MTTISGQRDLVIRAVLLIFVIISTYFQDLSQDYYQPLMYNQWIFYFLSEAVYVIFTRNRKVEFKWLYMMLTFLSIISLSMYLSEMTVYVNNFSLLSKSSSSGNSFPHIGPSLVVVTDNGKAEDEQIVTAFSLSYALTLSVVIIKSAELLLYLGIMWFAKISDWKVGVFSYKLNHHRYQWNSRYSYYKRLNNWAVATLILALIQGFAGMIWWSFSRTLMFSDVTNPTAVMMFFVLLVSFLGHSGKPFKDDKFKPSRQALNAIYLNSNSNDRLKALLTFRDNNLWNLVIPVFYFIVWTLLITQAVWPYAVKGAQGYSSVTACSGNLTSYYDYLENEARITGWYKNSQSIIMSPSSSESATEVVSTMLTATCMDEVLTWLIVVGSFFVFISYLAVVRQRVAAWEYILAFLDHGFVAEIEGNKLVKLDKEALLAELKNIEKYKNAKRGIASKGNIEIEIKKPTTKGKIDKIYL